LRNERMTGRQILGQRRFERRPGTNQKVPRPLPRSEWRVTERPDLRIVSDDLWSAAASRVELVGQSSRQAGKSLMRGRNTALYSKHLAASCVAACAEARARS
jgi:hypothetical protein